MDKVRKINIFIEKKSINNCIDRIYALVRSKQYLLKDSKKVLATKIHDFILIMKTWGWNAKTDDEGNIITLEYFGNGPLIYQKILFEELASDVKPGGFISFEIDNTAGSWEFDGQHLILK